MSLLNSAIMLACVAHQEQVDLGGDLYILHPLRVMLQMKTEEERITAVLHDVLEDSKFTPDYLRTFNFPENVLTALQTLSRKKGEPYSEYIRAISRNELAKKVKLADLQDNLNRSRIVNPTDRDHRRWEKYERAVETLLFGKQ